MLRSVAKYIMKVKPFLIFSSAQQTSLAGLRGRQRKDIYRLTLRYDINP
jgi:hypothetical protein